MGEFNIHADDPKDKGNKELCCVLDNFGLTQHVKDATHNRGHCLDLVISKGLNISKVVAMDAALSDHHCVFFESAVHVNKKSQTQVIKKRYIDENTTEMFIQAFCPSPPLSWPSVDELVDHFNGKITSIIDVIVPTKVKVITTKKKASWKNATLVKHGK